LTKINEVLLHILNKIFPPEKPSETELLSYLRETIPVEHRTIYTLEHLCTLHGTALQETTPGTWTCSTPHGIPSVQPQNEAQSTQQVQVQLDYVQQKRITKTLYNRKINQEIMADIDTKDITLDVSQRKTMFEIPAFTPPPRQVLPNQTGPAFQQDVFLLEGVPAEDLEKTIRHKAIRLVKIAS